MSRTSHIRRLKAIAKWMSAFALAVSLAGWWLAANYQFWLTTEGCSHDIQAVDGQILIRIEIPFTWETPDYSNCNFFEAESDGTWGWSMPYWHREDGDRFDSWEAQYYGGLPMWLPTSLLALITALLWKSSFRRRIRPGCCLRCGYDLTGNTSGVCSECGETAALSHEKSSR